jgi:pimeloyl-ACP methyl ester carboxylesterase
VPAETSSKESKIPWRRWGRLALWTLLFSYTLMMFLFTVLQRYLIYVPTRLSMASAEKSAAKVGFVPWRNSAGQLMGWKLPASSMSVGSVLIFHGNAGWALNRAYMALPIHDAAPLDVYIFEYPGFGAREGKPGEKNVLGAADEAFDNLPKNLPAYLVSESLGAGVAAHLAQNYPLRVAGIAMFVPYDKLAAVAQNHVPFIPAYYLLWDRFDPAEWLKNYHGPVFMVIAGADEIIPPKLGQRLYDGYNGPKILQVIPKARHADTTPETPQWWQYVLAFWQQNAPTNQISNGAN